MQLGGAKRRELAVDLSEIGGGKVQKTGSMGLHLVQIRRLEGERDRSLDMERKEKRGVVGKV